MTTLLIDADYIVYKACASAEYDIDWGDDVIMVGSRFSEAYANVTRELNKMKNLTKVTGIARNLVDTDE